MKIKVKGTDLEILEIEVNEEQVQELYESKQLLLQQVKDLTKQVSDEESLLKHTKKQLNEKTIQINEANILLTMLGVDLKSKDEESWNQTTLSIANRIALYIAGKTNGN